MNSLEWLERKLEQKLQQTKAEKNLLDVLHLDVLYQNSGYRHDDVSCFRVVKHSAPQTPKADLDKPSPCRSPLPCRQHTDERSAEHLLQTQVT